jgi:hypothetical protein
MRYMPVLLVAAALLAAACGAHASAVAAAAASSAFAPTQTALGAPRRLAPAGDGPSQEWLDATRAITRQLLVAQTWVSVGACLRQLAWLLAIMHRMRCLQALRGKVAAPRSLCRPDQPHAHAAGRPSSAPPSLTCVLYSGDAGHHVRSWHRDAGQARADDAPKQHPGAVRQPGRPGLEHATGAPAARGHRLR